MKDLIAAELFKLRTIASTWWILLATLVFVVLEELAFVFGNGQGSGPGQAQDPQMLGRALAAAGTAEIVVLTLGILALSQEFRFGTAAATFLVTPRRGRVVAAKMAALAVIGVGFGLVSVGLALPVAMWLIDLNHGTVLWTDRVWWTLLGDALCMILYGPLGVAIGALVRNQVAAIAGCYVWLLIVEALVTGLAPGLARWLPGGATSELLQTGTWFGIANLGPAWFGGLLLATYAVVLGAVGSSITMRRDLTS